MCCGIGTRVRGGGTAFDVAAARSMTSRVCHWSWSWRSVTTALHVWHSCRVHGLPSARARRTSRNFVIAGLGMRRSQGVEVGAAAVGDLAALAVGAGVGVLADVAGDGDVAELAEFG